MVRIENFNITVRSPTDTTEVKGIHLFLHPWEPGYLRIARLSAPGMPVWENLSAVTSYVNRNLYIKGLRLSPDLIIDEYNFDASQRAQNKGSMLLARASLWRQLSASISPAPSSTKRAKTCRTATTPRSRSTPPASICKPPPPTSRRPRRPPPGSRWLKAAFTGEPEHPRTWKGSAGVRADALAFGDARRRFRGGRDHLRERPRAHHLRASRRRPHHSLAHRGGAIAADHQ